MRHRHRRWMRGTALGAGLVAGAAAVLFAVGHREWAPVPVGAGWSGLCLWIWFYDLGRRTSRRWIARAGLTAVVLYGGALSFFALDRLAPQVVATDAGLRMRGVSGALIAALLATLASVVATVADGVAGARSGSDSS